MTNGTNGGEIISEWSGFRGRGTLEDVVTELRRQITVRRDVVADVRDLKVIPGTKQGEILLAANTPSGTEVVGFEGMPVLRQAMTQIAGKAGPGVSVREGDKVMTHGKDLATTRIWCDYVTALMHADPARRLVRTLDGKVRAYLSDTYKVIESLDVAAKALETAQRTGARVLEASLSDQKMRIKFVSTEIWQTIEAVRTAQDGREWYAGGIGSQKYLSKVAAKSWRDLPNLDEQGGAGTCWPSFTIGNSDTGHGSFYGEGSLLLAVCFNLATVTERVHKVHLGERLDTGVFTARTVQLEADTIFSKVGDLMNAYFTPSEFAKIVATCQKSAATPIERPVEAIGNVIGASDSLNESQLDDLMAAFSAQPGGSSLFNLGQAVARIAQDIDDAEQSADLEAFAGQIITGKIGGLVPSTC